MALALFVTALPASARGMELVLGWRGATRWDSNVLRTSENEEADFSILTGPTLELRKPQGDVTGQLRWESLWRGFLKTSDANGFEHSGDLAGRWQADARNLFEIDNQFSRTDSVTSLLDTADGNLTGAGRSLEAGTDFILQNNVRGTFSRRLSPLMTLEASVANALVQFEDEEDSDSLSTRGLLQITRALNERMVAGIGTAFTRQDFDDTIFQEGSGASIAEVFGIFNYQITPTLRMSLSLGPALNQPDDIDAIRRVPEVPTLGSFLVDAASCPNSVFGSGCSLAVAQNLATGALTNLAIATGSVPIVEAAFLDGAPEADDALTLFGAFSLVKRWERSSAQLRLQRRTSSASGDGTSQDLTLANVVFNWQPARRWSLTAIAAWTLQTSASEFPITELVVTPGTVFVDSNGRVVEDASQAAFRADGAAIASGVRTAGSSDSAFERTTYQLQFRATRRISRRLVANARTSWLRLEQSGDLQVDTTRDIYRLDIGIRWEFDPIRF
ncbi:hypothetical protein KJ059_11525 [Myxococcota bacterium]|nr:hypothetical protein [Myxococcota bacterium]